MYILRSTTYCVWCKQIYSSLNFYFPSRNASLGLRFPWVFHSKENWKVSQQYFYSLIIISNIVILLLYALGVDSKNLLNGLSLLSLLTSAIITFIYCMFINK
ncbi:SdpI family protein [Streptococcus loxodontisalivarius]|uniref:SdpI family protein n=1 Tax=Streptococcus loxodontisalivarius TaxID=1349415 RepID=UPI001961FAF8